MLSLSSGQQTEENEAPDRLERSEINFVGIGCWVSVSILKDVKNFQVGKDLQMYQNHPLNKKSVSYFLGKLSDGMKCTCRPMNRGSLLGSDLTRQNNLGIFGKVFDYLLIFIALIIQRHYVNIFSIHSVT